MAELCVKCGLPITGDLELNSLQRDDFNQPWHFYCRYPLGTISEGSLEAEDWRIAEISKLDPRRGRFFKKRRLNRTLMWWERN